MENPIENNKETVLILKAEKSKEKIIRNVLIVASVLLLVFFKECHIKFNGDTLTEIVSLLVTYGILAALIERFVDKIVILEKYSNRMQNKSMGIENTNSIKVHDRALVLMSFYVGLFVSALGFRFFTNITEGQCSSVFYCEYILPFSDIFLTGILLSGGAQFIFYLISLFNPSIDKG